ncbi:hypothetical protein IAT40_003079 [Kwoniella sp. CBS 6097]
MSSPFLNRTALLLGISTYIYVQHRRRILEYPIHSVPPALEIDSRQDKPYTTPEWGRCDAGDVWAVRVPPKLANRVKLQRSTHGAETRASTLDDQNGRGGDDVDLGILWARAFMGSWPLRLESLIIRSLSSLGVHAFQRKENVPQSNKDSTEGANFQTGDAFVNGVFIVEAHDEPALTTEAERPHDPASTRQEDVTSRVILRWGSVVVPPIQPGSSTPSAPEAPISIMGGYHTLAVLPSTVLFPAHGSATVRPLTTAPAAQAPDSPNQSEDELYFVFASHAVHRKMYGSTDGHSSTETAKALLTDHPGSLSTAEYMKDRPFMDRLLVWFHHEYSRVLVDLAIRRIQNGVA